MSWVYKLFRKYSLISLMAGSKDPFLVQAGVKISSLMLLRGLDP